MGTSFVCRHLHGLITSRTGQIAQVECESRSAESLSDVFIHTVAFVKIFVFIATREDENGDSKALKKLPSIDPIVCPKRGALAKL